MGRFTIPILSNFLEQIGDGVVNALLKLVWSLIKGLMFILDGLQEAFFFITGVEKMKINFNGDEIGITLLEMMFGITLNWSEDGKLEYHNLDFSVPLHKTYFAMLGVFAVVFVFIIVCSIIKININREDKESLPSLYKMFWKCFLAFAIVILMPVIFCILLSFAGIFMKTIIEVFKVNLLGGDTELTISECLFKASLSPEAIDKFGKDKEPTWYADELKTAGISYEELISTFDDGGVNFVLLLMSVCCCLVGIGMSVLTVAERLINIAMLYVISPVVVASIPLDDGKRWESWKDTTTVKILTAAANVISIYLFIYIMVFFGNIILSGENENQIILSLVYIVIAISGSFGCAKAGTFLANIISANAGQQEGMSQMASQGMLRMAGGLAGGVMKTAGGLLGLNKLTNKNGSNGGGIGTGGTLNGNTGGSLDTAHTKDNQNLSDSFNNMQQIAKNNAGGAIGGSDANGSGKEPGFFGKVGNIAGTVSRGMKSFGNAAAQTINSVGRFASNNLNVPGLIKMAAVGAGVGGASLVGGVVTGGKMILDGLLGKKNKVDKGSLNGTGNNKEVKEARKDLEKQSRPMNRELKAVDKTKGKIDKNDTAIQKTLQKLDKKNAKGSDTEKLENKLEKQVKKGDKLQNQLGEHEHKAKAHQRLNNQKQIKLNQAVGTAQDERSKKVDSIKQKIAKPTNEKSKKEQNNKGGSK